MGKKLAKIIILIFLFSFTSHFSTINAQKEDRFDYDYKVEYKFHNGGEATVTNTISIRNLKKEYFSERYSLKLKSLDPKNVKAYESGNQLEVVEKKIDKDHILEVIFEDDVVGVGETRTFVVTYEITNFALRTGKVWEISIPKFGEITPADNHEVDISVPKSFGDLAYISPQPDNKNETEDRYIYSYDNKVGVGGVVAGFGEFQIYSFEIKYHVKNKKNTSGLSDITIPPDTSTQKVFYENISPTPENIVVDRDGNWIAKIKLKPKEERTVVVKGMVQIFAQPRKYLDTDPVVFLNNTKETEFWQINDSEINKLAKELITAENIYNFVVENLSYDYTRIDENAERLGAVGSLKRPNNALCTEYSDLFIALSRSAGIPAREIVGYAQTENEDLQPLSLVADVLHSWPEYYNDELSVWVPVDPTWGSTTKGVDYFNKLDLKHFAFVIHGTDSEKPIPPGVDEYSENPEKDIFVRLDQFENLPLTNGQDINIYLESSNNLSLLNKNSRVIIENSGPSATYNIFPKVQFDDEVVMTDYIRVLPPYSSYENKITIPYGFMANKMPNEINIEAGNSSITLPMVKNKVIFTQLGVILLSILIVLVFLLHKIGKLKPMLNVYEYSKNSFFKKRNK